MLFGFFSVIVVTFRYYQMLADPVKYPEGMHYRIDLLKQKQKNTKSFERPIWRRPAPADKIAGAAGDFLTTQCAAMCLYFP